MNHLKLVPMALLTLAIGISALVPRDAHAQAIAFAPFYGGCFDDAVGTVDPQPFKGLPRPAEALNGGAQVDPEECDGVNTVGASPDTTTAFGIPANNAQFAATVGFTPAAWVNEAAPRPAVGAIVGRLESRATLGLINSYCGYQGTFIDLVGTSGFTLISGSIDFNDATIDSKPVIDGKAQTKPMQPLIDDVNPANGIPDGADHYPAFLLEYFPEIQQSDVIGRGFGGILIKQADNEPVVIQFIVVKPGTKVSNAFNLDPALGYPSVGTLQDPTLPATPGPISDFCTPLDVLGSSFGTSQDNPATAGVDESGTLIRKLPADGLFPQTIFVPSQRDYDGDGLGNSGLVGLDPCPYQPNPDWNPSEASSPENPNYTGDANLNMIPDVCDPCGITPMAFCTVPATPGYPEPNLSIGPAKGTCANANTFDYDCDGFLNRGDMCPTTADETQQDHDQLRPPYTPFGDNIGDACDTNPNCVDPADNDGDGVANDGCDGGPPVAAVYGEKLDGAFAFKCLTYNLTVGAGGAAPPDPNLFQPCTPGACYPSTSPDCAGQNITDPTNPDTTNTNTGGGTGGSGSNVGGAGGPGSSGVGSLAAGASSVPAWAAILSGFGAAGLLAGLGLTSSRFVRRRRP